MYQFQEIKRFVTYLCVLALVVSLLPNGYAVYGTTDAELLKERPAQGASCDVTVNAGDVVALADAMTAANASPTPRTICLQNGTYTLGGVLNNTLNGPNGLPVVTGSMRIKGLGGAVTSPLSKAPADLDAPVACTLTPTAATMAAVIERPVIRRDPLVTTPAFRLFEVAATGNLTLENLELKNGDSGTSRDGGAIYNKGAVTLDNADLNGNRAATSGGAVYNAGSLTVTATRFARNYANAIHNAVNSTLVINSGEFEDNLTRSFATASPTAATDGGAIYNLGNATVSNAIFTSNVAGRGGAIANLSTMTLRKSTLGRNMAPDASAVLNTGTLNVEDSTIADSRPYTLALEPIGDRTIALGSAWRYKLSATYVGGPGAVTFGVSPLPVPANASLNATTGEFHFRPAADQVGTFEFTFSASNGDMTSSETVRITVLGPVPGAPTALQGRVLDANEMAAGRTIALVGATIRHIESGIFTRTDSQGMFTLSGLPAGPGHFDIDGVTAAPTNTYGAYRADRDLIANVVNTFDAPLLLMKIDPASITPVTPSATVTVNNPNLQTQVVIPPNTVKEDNGSFFTGNMSISEVPVGFTPQSLPETLGPSRVISIQPMGLTFAQPVPVRFPNWDNMPPGTLLDLWSLSHDTGEFFIAGTGKVTADGLWVETINGGIRESSWHFPLPQPPTPRDPRGDPPPGGPDDDEDPGPCAETGSSSTIRNGCLRTAVTLPPYTSLNASRALTIVYKSSSAFPQLVIPFEASVPSNGAIPPQTSYTLKVGGVASGAETFINTSTLAGTDRAFRAAAAYDATNIETGTYRYQFDVKSRFANTTTTARFGYRASVVNEQDSPFGAGWSVAGLTKLYQNEDGSLLVTDGAGSAQTFSPLPSDLSLWRQEGNPLDGSWTLSADKLQVTQGTEGETSFFVSPGSYINTRFRGTIRVSNTTDNDFVGLVFGYKRPADANGDLANQYEFMLFDWRRADQTFAGITATEGSRLVRVNGFFEDLLPGFWGSESSPQFEVIATQFGAGNGWLPNTDYEFDIDYRSDCVRVLIDGVPIFAVPGNYSPGQVGFFTYSQRDVRFTAALDANQFSGPPGDYSTITRNGDGTFTRVFKDGMRTEYNAEGLETATIDLNGNTTSMTYDAQGRLLKIKDPVNLETAFTYSGLRLDAVTDPFGRVTTFQHDAEGNLIAVTFPDGTQRTYGYDNRHLMTTETDERGKTTTRVYDSVGKMIEATLADGSVRRISPAQTVGLPGVSGSGTVLSTAAVPVTKPSDAVTTITDGEGRVTRYLIGKNGENAAVIDPAGLVTRYEHDRNGNISNMQLPSGLSASATYDANGNLLSFRDNATNGVVSFGYDSIGNVVSITDAFGKTTTASYDANGNLARIVTPQERSASYVYNSQGFVTSLTDILGTVSEFSYNSDGNLISSVSGTGSTQRSTTVAYDANGRLSTITDTLGNVHRFAYDALGQPISIIQSGNRVTSYTYDSKGNLNSITPPNRPAHLFLYNDADLLTEYKAPVVANGGTNSTVYTYSPARQITQIVRPDSKLIRFTYDSAGRIGSIGIARGQLTYSYNPTSGKLLSITTPDGDSLSHSYIGEIVSGHTWTGAISGTLSLAYNASRQIISEQINGNNLVSFQYSDDGQLTRAGNLVFAYSPITGMLTTTTLGSITDSTTYNSFGETASYATSFGDNKLIELQYVRDGLGRITMLTETLQGVVTTFTYSYDSAGRLVQVQTDGTLAASYTYDSNGNRLTVNKLSGVSIGTYDDQDRLLQFANTTFTYTANGELSSRTQAGQTTQFEYDELGSLLSVTKPDGTRIDYVIDGTGRRIGKGLNSTTLRGWLYQDDLRIAAELDASNSIVSRFVYGDNINVPEYMIRAGTTYRIVTDNLGSVRLVVNTSTGQIVQQISYDEFGNVLIDTNPGFQPFGFAGGHYDPDTRLIRFGSRDYDPAIGRWTAKDPTGFSGDTTNLYSYVGNNPVNFIDPDGNIAFIPILIGMGIGAGIEIGLQLLQNGGRFECIEWGWVALQGGLGGLGGMLNGTRVVSNTGRMLASGKYSPTRLFWDPRTYNTVQKQYRSFGNYVGAGNQLGHMWVRNSARNIPQGLRNAGLNLMELPRDINRWGGRNIWNDRAIRAGTAAVAGDALYQGSRLPGAAGGSGSDEDCGCK